MLRNKEFQKEVKENLEKINLENTNNDIEIKEIIDALEFVIKFGSTYVNLPIMLDDAREILKEHGCDEIVQKINIALKYYENFIKNC